MRIDSIEIVSLLKLGLWEQAIIQCDVKIVDIYVQEAYNRNIYVRWLNSNQNIQGHYNIQGHWI